VRRIFLLFLLLIFSRSVFGQDWARDRLEKSSRHREWVTVKHDNRELATLLVYPSSENKVPVVLVIHEGYGMTDWAQLFADEVAADGYIVVAPDLLSGAGPNGGRTPSFSDQDKAAEATQHLNPDQVTADLRAAADYGLKLPLSNGQLFVVGFDWGGEQAFRFATNRDGITATFVYYGRSPDRGDMMRITAPVYGFYAGVDESVNSTLPDAKVAMKAAGKIYEPVMYDAAEHGFMRSGEAPGGKPPNIIARQEAKERLEILIRRLSPKSK
jgi:carboxymethylenebutenolidase